MLEAARPLTLRRIKQTGEFDNRNIEKDGYIFEGVRSRGKYKNHIQGPAVTSGGRARPSAENQPPVRVFPAGKTNGAELIHEQSVHQAIAAPDAPTAGAFGKNLKDIFAVH